MKISEIKGSVTSRFNKLENASEIYIAAIDADTGAVVPAKLTIGFRFGLPDLHVEPLSSTMFAAEERKKPGPKKKVEDAVEESAPKAE